MRGGNKLFSRYFGEVLFTVLHNDDYLLHYILPDRRNNSYSLWPRHHELMLAIRSDSSSKDLCLKTCINSFTHFYNFYWMYLYFLLKCCIFPAT